MRWGLLIATIVNANRVKGPACKPEDVLPSLADAVRDSGGDGVALDERGVQEQVARWQLYQRAQRANGVA